MSNNHGAGPPDAGEGNSELSAIGSMNSLASDYTGSNKSDWDSYTATATAFQTSTTAPASTSASLTSSGTSSGATATGTTASENANLESSSSGGGISSGVKAAIGVGAVVGVVAIVALAFFFLRRRRRNNEEAASVNEKPRTKWMSHFRNFTFDNEMLLSERGSVRTRRSARSVIGSIRNNNTDTASTAYRNVNTEPAYQHQSQASLDRSLSVRTDDTVPPPYQPRAEPIGDVPESPVSPDSTHRNPFSDSRSNSPVRERASVDENPFSDSHRQR